MVLAATTSTMMFVAGVGRLFVATKETTMAASTRAAAFKVQTHGLELHHRL
jgi:hypothetical protein